MILILNQKLRIGQTYHVNSRKQHDMTVSSVVKMELDEALLRSIGDWERERRIAAGD
jgi:hypothetical protein